MSPGDKQMSDTALSHPGITIQKISKDAPWEWLAKGWHDLWVTPAISLTYGFMFFATPQCREEDEEINDPNNG